MAIGFTSAGVSMMPSTKYDVSRHAWVDMTDAERARMSADYNLRVGLMMAALSFGADPGIQRVSMHIDSIGLEEAVAEQDSAISELMSEALAAFERIRTGDMGVSGSKADRRTAISLETRPVRWRRDPPTWALMASTPRIRMMR